MVFDIFCRVVDNYGDAAVCWRLARELATEQGVSVRLWIEAIDTLRALVPEVQQVEQQRVGKVEVFDSTVADRSSAALPDVVVEAFGCGLPESYIARMTSAAKAPLWIVLEYLSAEPWVVEHHGLSSPHPQLNLERYFFFPGFVRGTGGVLREADLFERRDRFGANERDAFWKRFGYAAPDDDALVVSMFAYASAPIEALLHALRRSRTKLVVAIPEGPLLERARSSASQALEIRVLPFLPQSTYDELLWSCAINFVRGEDSFVRAQWAARPFIWHAYPQTDSAHLRKLDAFLALYTNGIAESAGVAIARLMHLWNSEGDDIAIAEAWHDFVAERGRIDDHARAWCTRLTAVGDLAANLAEFCAGKLK